MMQFNNASSGCCFFQGIAEESFLSTVCHYRFYRISTKLKPNSFKTTNFTVHICTFQKINFNDLEISLR